MTQGKKKPISFTGTEREHQAWIKRAYGMNKSFSAWVRECIIFWEEHHGQTPR